MKLLMKPKIAAAVIGVCDLILLIAAIVLDAVRAKVPADLSFDPAQVKVEVSHPYEYFGIATAVFLAIAAVMTGFMIAGALAGTKVKTAARLVGAAVLLIVSVAVIIFAHFFVCGAPVEDTACFVFQNGGVNIAVQETKYSFGSGMMDVYKLEGDMMLYAGEAASKVSVTHITGTGITEFATNSSRYTLDEVYDAQMRLRFFDGDIHRTLQFTLE